MRFHKWCSVACALVVFCGGPARAGTRRFALLVGHNRGAQGQPDLQFAEDDAEELSRVLVEVGGVAAADLTLLRGPHAEAVRTALAGLAAKVRNVHGSPAERAVVVFYYSGHSDGESLELGGDRLEFAELRSLLSATGADVRVVLLDSCRSGALLALKGGQPAPAFQIRLSDEIASSGEALISSSASDEMALESREIRGSFFTHHLVSGLRGAADTSGDGRVTLAEAYEYVFQRTVSATAATTVGPQHPGYTYRLSGEGDLVLTDLNVRTARLTIPTGLDRALIIDRRGDHVLAEVGPGGASRLALPAGEYLVRATMGKKAMGATLRLGDGEQRALSAAELTPAPLEEARGKGDFERGAALWALALGASRGVGVGVGVLPALRVARQEGPLGLAVQVASGHGEAFRETSALLSATYSFLAAGTGTIAVRAGPELAAGAILQARRSDPVAWSPAAAAGGQVGVSLQVERRLALSLSVHVLAEALNRDGELEVRALPSAFAGLSVWP
jgi:Caspase domain